MKDEKISEEEANCQRLMSVPGHLSDSCNAAQMEK
jgi:hypothetical protein